MIALDIFIGLVLIYFLYSLLVSIIAEMISTWIGMRSRMLRQGIENLLNDKQPVEDVQGNVLKYTKNILSKNSKIENKRKYTRESLISYFQQFPNILSGLIGWIKDIFLVESDKFKYTTAGRFYKEPTIKYMAKVGDNAMYSTRHTKPAYITKENFTLTVLNMVSARSQGINEWEKIKFAIKHNAMALEPETLKMFQDWVARANDSYENFITNIERTYVGIMDRVNGWYKRKIGLFIFWIGFIICMVMNVDSIEIVKILSNDPEKRKQMVELAKQTIEAREAHQNTPNDVQNKELYELLRSELDSTKAIIDKSKTIMANGWGNMTTNQILQNSMPWNGNKFWGFLITALALSLGSQFWYDLLKKLVEIRGAGVKPEERSDKLKEELEIKKNGNDGSFVIEYDPLKRIIANNRNYWESLPGFISMNEDLNDENTRYIKLVYEKNKTPFIEKKFIELDTEIWAKTVEGEKGILGDDLKRDPIHGAILQLNTHSWGTPAGIVRNPRTGKYAILTCGHVIRTEKSSFLNKNTSSVYLKNNFDKTYIGKATNMVMSGYCDAGIIDLDIGLNKLKEIIDVPHIKNYNVINFKSKETTVKIMTLEGGKDGISGKLIKTDEYFTFDDVGTNDIRYFDLLKIGSIKSTTVESNKTLTLNGDSGSLITDEERNPIGILVGGGWENGIPFSFGIKINDIFQILQLEKSDII